MVARSVSRESQGASTCMLGRMLIRASSSSAWWVAPSAPTEMPPCAPAIFTFRFE